MSSSVAEDTQLVGNPNGSSDSRTPKTQPVRAAARPSPLEDAAAFLSTAIVGYRMRRPEYATLHDLGKGSASSAVEDIPAHRLLRRPRNATAGRSANYFLWHKGLVRQGSSKAGEGNSARIGDAGVKQATRLLRANRLVAKDKAIYHGFRQGRAAKRITDAVSTSSTRKGSRNAFNEKGRTPGPCPSSTSS